MNTTDTVGFIGLGIMGQPMSLNLIKAGFPLIAYNRTRSKAEALAKEGARVASSPREVAQQASTIIVKRLTRRGAGGAGQRWCDGWRAVRFGGHRHEHAVPGEASLHPRPMPRTWPEELLDRCRQPVPGAVPVAPRRRS